MCSVDIDPVFQLSTSEDDNNLTPFTIHELNNALQDKKLSASGMDELAYPMLKTSLLEENSYC